MLICQLIVKEDDKIEFGIIFDRVFYTKKLIQVAKITEQSKLLASYVVFRELYDNNKDVYQIIAEFLAQLIISESKNGFNLFEITNLLNKTYGFDIPQSVVKTALSKLEPTKSKGTYTFDN